MKKRRLTLLTVLVALLSLLPAGCAGERGEEGGYNLYFLAAPGGGRGAALEAQRRDLGDGPDPGELLSALLSGPEGEELSSPFPKGVTLQSWAWDKEVPGKVLVVLSEQYSGLTDISLTLADYSIVLTLSQLPGVESVEIQSTGYSANYRAHQTLSPEEAVLSDPLEGVDKSEK